MNPYWGKDFFEVLALFFKRLPFLISGQTQIVSDELQIFVLITLGLSTAMIGVFLVLKGSTMQANALSHTVLIGIAVLVIGAPFFGLVSEGGDVIFSLTALILAGSGAALLTVFLTYLAHTKLGLQEDASIGLIFTFLFAIGILLITLYTRNLHIGSEAIMGNLDAVHPHDLYLLFIVLIKNSLLIFLCYHRYKMIAFDPGFAKSVRGMAALYDIILVLQTTVTIMAGFRAVGVILVLSLITAPILIARLFTARLLPLMFISCLISTAVSLFAVAASRHILSLFSVPVSTSSLMPLFLLFLFLISAMIRVKKRVRA